MSEIIIFTDGCCRNNQDKHKREAGVGVFFGDSDKRNISYPLKGHPQYRTNQVAELTACIRGIEGVLGSEIVMAKDIIIYTDSMYIVNMMSSWCKKWKENGWRRTNNKEIENLRLVKTLYHYKLNLGVIFRHVKAHRKLPSPTHPEYELIYGNYMADKLANEGADKY